MSVKEKINNLKCFTDLHIHIDGSVSVKSARELAVIENITLPEEDEQLKNMLMVSDDCHDLNEYLEKFTLPVSLMQSKESLKKCAYNLCTELRENGLMYAELRFAPQKHCEKGLSQEEVVQAVLEGIKSSGFSAGLILCCMRDGSDNKKENLETIRLTGKNLGNGVCACDLAGAEALFPNEQYDYVFRTLNELKIPFTVHSGEALGADSVRYAVENGAFRIGHGVRSAEDEEVVDLLIKKDIPLEICPTSNINTCVFEKISDMPVAELLGKGVIVTLNTDNTSVSSTDIKREYIKVSEAFDFDLGKIKKIIQNSVRSSFADDEMKRKMFEIIDREFEN